MVHSRWIFQMAQGERRSACGGQVDYAASRLGYSLEPDTGCRASAAGGASAGALAIHLARGISLVRPDALYSWTPAGAVRNDHGDRQAAMGSQGHRVHRLRSERRARPTEAG